MNERKWMENRSYQFNDNIIYEIIYQIFSDEAET